MKLTRSPFFKVALAIVVGASIAWAFWPARLRPVTKSTTPAETVDSLAFYRQKEQEHHEAGAIIRTDNEKRWKAYHDTAAMRAPGWDSLRTRYRDSIQSQIRRKFAR